MTTTTIRPIDTPMKKSLLLIAALVVFATGCSKPILMRGATSLTPNADKDSERVWIYLDTNNIQVNGIYRCVDEGHKAYCMRAHLK